MHVRPQLKLLISSVAQQSENIVFLLDKVAGLETEVAGIKAEQAGIKAEVAGIKTEVVDIKAGQAGMNKKLDLILEHLTGGSK